MSVELRRENGDEFVLSTSAWGFHLYLAAEAYGWEMPGTSAPADWSLDNGPWPGAYDWNAGQTVESADALALAGALERHLAAADRDQIAKDLAREMQMAMEQALGSKLPGEWLPGTDDEFVASFIRFAKQGGFQIY
ncbi:hypothetical protein OU994_21530 [Pseudoduganella sp. SL102]|uniref:hypothetical protein n=1 Tax=Pseudoduganella sp. SL102 TaxID=2995154 RepID=UPI00248AECF6|nr:hypothetical protein [Pseudoduganella sp. SL102]WBS00870.1 hypothetical protein OU994_21530 [Pseudoduganella sp. SL102]